VRAEPHGLHHVDDAVPILCHRKLTLELRRDPFPTTDQHLDLREGIYLDLDVCLAPCGIEAAAVKQLLPSMERKPAAGWNPSRKREADLPGSTAKLLPRRRFATECKRQAAQLLAGDSKHDLGRAYPH